MATSASRRFNLWPLAICASAGVFAVFAWLRSTPDEPAPTDTAGGGAAPALECPDDQLPDDGVCIPVPPPEEGVTASPAAIELLPGRAVDYTRYVTPIAAYPAAPARHGLGLFVAAPRGVPVTAIELEAQTSPTRRRVIASSPPRLLTLHRVERAGATRSYVLAYEGLAFDTTPTANDVAVGTPLGRVAAAPGLTGLGLTVRQLRRGVDPERASAEQLLTDSSSLACDPRNVLPAKPLIAP